MFPPPPPPESHLHQIQLLAHRHYWRRRAFSLKPSLTFVKVNSKIEVELQSDFLIKTLMLIKIITQLKFHLH